MALKIKVNQVQLLQFLNRQQSNRQFSRLLEISFTLVVVTFFVIFAIRPSVVTIAALFGEVKAKQEFSTLMRSQISKIVEAQDIYAQIQSRSSSIDKALGLSPNFVYSKNQILWLASTSQVNIESIGFVPPPKINDPKQLNNPLKSVSARFNFVGNYESTLNFLSQLVQLKKVGQISRFSISLPLAQKKVENMDNLTTSPPVDQLESSFQLDFNYWSPHE